MRIQMLIGFLCALTCGACLDSSSAGGAGTDQGRLATAADGGPALRAARGDDTSVSPGSGSPAVGATPTADAGSTTDPEPQAPRAAGEGSPSGWYVHWRKVSDDGNGGYVVDKEISEEDMAPIGGSAEEIVVLGFDPATSRYHRQKRVVTGSDYQRSGSYTFAQGQLHIQLEQSFSCAHPHDGSYASDNEEDLEVRLDEEANLWLMNRTGAWIYRPISAEDAHFRYNISYCAAARAGVDGCHCLCSSRDFLNDYSCYE